MQPRLLRITVEDVDVPPEARDEDGGKCTVEEDAGVDVSA